MTWVMREFGLLLPRMVTDDNTQLYLIDSQKEKTQFYESSIK